VKAGIEKKAIGLTQTFISHSLDVVMDVPPRLLVWIDHQDNFWKFDKGNAMGCVPL